MSPRAPRSPRFWLVVAALFFTTLSLTVYAMKSSGRFPSLIDENGTWRFIPDSDDQYPDSLQLAQLFWNGEWHTLWDRLKHWYTGSPTKLYWICYALLGPSEANVIPLNLVFYLIGLIVVYQIGKRLWEPRTGFWAAALVALWPSALLHRVFPVKDSIFIAGQALFVYGLIRFVGRDHRLRDAMKWGALLLVGFLLSGTVRPHVVILDIPLVVLANGLVLVRLLVRFRSREPLLKLVVGMAVVLVTLHLTKSVFGLIDDIPARQLVVTPAPAVAAAHAAASAVAPTSGFRPRHEKSLAAKDRWWIQKLVDWSVYWMWNRRTQWVHSYRDSYTNLDTHVEYDTFSELLAYCPRAAQIGFLSPFPNLWFETGRRVGRLGRLVAGMETLILYGLLPLALVGAWRNRRKPEIWFLVLYIVSGVMLIGLIVTNAGAIFRMRYVYFFFLILFVVPSLLRSTDAWSRFLTRRRIVERDAVEPPGRPGRDVARPRVDPVDRIRILRIITRTNIGGPALHATLLTERLDARRYESRLLTGPAEPTEGNYLEHQERGIGAVQVLPALCREIRPLRDVVAFVQLYRAIRRFRPHIVHTHMAKAGALGRIAARLAGVPVVVHTYHGHVLQGYFGRITTKFFLTAERRLSRLTDCLVTVSESVRQELVELGIGAPERFAVVPLGLELSSFLQADGFRGQLRQELGIGQEELVVGIVARLVPIKRHEDFLHAVRQVITQIPEARFLVVGDGERRADLERLARSLGLEDRVRFLGWRKDIARVYADCDLVVLTSANEGLPVSLIEAMAAARAVVATRVGGVLDLVQDGVTGLLVPPKDPHVIASAIIRLLKDASLRQSMGEAGRQKVREAFEAERLFRDVDALYQDLVHRKRGDLPFVSQVSARPGNLPMGTL